MGRAQRREPGIHLPARRNAVAITVAILTAVVVGALGLTPAAAVAHGTPRGGRAVPVRRQADAEQHPAHRRVDVRQRLLGRPDLADLDHHRRPLLPRRLPQPGQRPDAYPTTATLNTADLATSPGEARSVVEVRQSSANDIAVAKLSAPVTDVRPLALNTVRPVNGQLLTLAGWGATSSVNPTPPDQLITGGVKIWSVQSTTVLVRGYSPAPDTSACLYDLGAPYWTIVPGLPAL